MDLMKSQGLIWIVFSLIAFMLIVGACQVPPSLQGVEGRLFLYSAGNIFEIPTSSTAENAADLRIAGPGLHEQYIAFWPEKNYFTYRTENAVELLDLVTREIQTFSTGPTHCATWSPDFAHISHVSTKSEGTGLYLYNIASGSSTLVYAVPSATYEDGLTREGAVTCGAWVGADRFVFDRTVGMPGQLTSINGVTEGIPTNTTTLAIIGEPLKLVDAPRELSVYGVSEDGRHLIYGEQKSGIINLYHVSLPPAFDSFESLSPRLIASEFYYNSFTMSGNEVAFDDYEKDQTRIRIVNLDTFEERLGPTITGLYGWIWAATFQDHRIIFQDDAGSIWLVDTNTQASVLLASDALVKDMQNLGMQEGFSYPGFHLIAWLPSN